MWLKIIVYMILCFNVDISFIICMWIFIGEEGLRFFIIVDEIIFIGLVIFNLKNDDGNYNNIFNINIKFKF